MQQPRIETLQRMPIFGGMQPDTLEFLVDSAQSRDVAKNGYFFRENEVPDFIYVLESGSVAVLKSWLGKEYKIRHLGPGDCFGEMALIDLFPRSASVVALSDCKAIALSPDVVHRLCERNLEQFALIQMNFARELSRRLRIADDRIFSFKMGQPFTDEEELPPVA
ncbi:MAG: Crp/Fnr family transcriptional regulator [Betaproteobacteria bacterium]|jgi:CRP-like cAMP-binding protein|nr:MAG: Crp/Fnr family transcriptional regulator [Betaproteobacteria bacterium]